MPVGLRNALYAVLFVLLSAFAHAPLARAGWLGKDLATLARQDAGERAGPAGLWRGEDGEQRPLATLALALSGRLRARAADAGDDVARADAAAAPLVRLESLLWLWACAAAVGLALRRTLLPWTGSGGAGAAGAAAALVLACHPLVVPIVAHPGARADLVALTLSATALATFLRARQERAPRLLPVAVLLAVAAGFASAVAWLTPALAAGLELASARRHRPLHVRLRTSATTLLVFAGAVTLEGLAAGLLGVRSGGRPLAWLIASDVARAGGAGDGATRLAHGVEKVGLLVLPVASETAGALSFVVAGALALLALQPALVAARSAPRLWGWILLSSGAALACALALRSAVRVTPGDLSRAEVLFAATAIAAAGLAVAATAVSGARRWLFPLLLAVGYAALAHSAARAWPVAGAALAGLEADLAAARELHGRAAALVVLDPPAKVAGLEVVDDALPLLVDATGPDAPAVFGLSRAAFVAFARTPAAAELRRTRLVLLEPARGADADRDVVALAPPEPSTTSTGSFVWRADDRSPLLDLDPFEKPVLRVSFLPTASTAAVPEVTWRAREEAFKEGARDGAWIAGEDGPVALFDLAGSLDWLCGRRILRLRVAGEAEQIVSAEILDALPRIALGPGDAGPDGDDWRFRLDAGAPVPRVLRGTGRFVLGLLDAPRGLYKELEPEAGDADELRFRGARAAAGPGPVDWSLELRVGAVAVARTTGRTRRP